MAKYKRQKVKRYRRSFYSRGTRIKKGIGNRGAGAGGAGRSLAGSTPPCWTGLTHTLAILW